MFATRIYLKSKDLVDYWLIKNQLPVFRGSQRQPSILGKFVIFVAADLGASSLLSLHWLTQFPPNVLFEERVSIIGMTN